MSGEQQERQINTDTCCCRFTAYLLSGCKRDNSVQTSNILLQQQLEYDTFTEIKRKSYKFFAHCSSLLMLPKRRNMVSSLFFFFTYHNLLFISSLLPVIAESALVPTWDSEPLNQSQYRGLSAAIDCRIRDLGDRMITWSKIINLETKLLFINDNRFDAPDRYQSVPFQPAGTAAGYQLVLTDLVEDDDAQYVCQVQQSLKKAAYLTVLVPPGPPRITSNATQNGLMEEDNVQLNCTSSEGNPPPLITWLRNDVPIPPSSFTSYGPVVKFGTVLSVLVWKVTPSDHLANFTCSVRSNASTSDLRTTEQLQVKFAPVLSLGSFDPLIVREGSSVVLNCSVYANPPVDDATITWLRNGSIISTGSRLTLNEVSTGNAGTYSCWAKNYADRTKQIELEVQYPARLSVISFTASTIVNGSIEIMEGSLVDINCSSDSNPVINSSAIYWTKDGVVVQYGGRLTIGSVQRSHRGFYFCSATNVMTLSGKQPYPVTSNLNVMFLVLYKPGSATISPASISVIKGDNVTLECHVSDPGYPPSDFTWTRDSSGGMVVHEGSKWFINHVQLLDSGDYACIASNRIGSGTPDVRRLVVNERPEWLLDQLPSQTVININMTDINLSCSVRGIPAPNVTWSRNGVPVPADSSSYDVGTEQQPIDTVSFRITSYLHFKGSGRRPTDASLQIADAGNYTCNATNAHLPRGLSQTTKLIVEHSPIFNVTSLINFISADLHQSTSLQYFASAVPQPTFQWYNGSQQIKEDDRISLSEWKVDRESDVYASSLSISSVDVGDYRNYSLKATNKYGLMELTVELQKTSIPWPPGELSVHTLTWESVDLSWRPGYDGGRSQSFIVYYSWSLDPSGGRNESAVNATDSRINVTGLLPNHNYTFSVVAFNSNGFSSPSKSIVINTKDFMIAPPVDLFYNPKTHTITFSLQGTDFCLRVDVFDGTTWSNSIPCAAGIAVDDDTESSRKVQLTGADVDARTIFNISASVCLTRRPEICSSLLNAKHYTESSSDIPLSTIIAVSCSCVAVVVILAVVLAILCCRRRRQLLQKKNEKNKSNSLSSGSHELQYHQKIQPSIHTRSTGFDNPIIGTAWIDQTPNSRQPNGRVTSDKSRPVSNNDILNNWNRNSFHSPNNQLHLNDIDTRSDRIDSFNFHLNESPNRHTNHENFGGSFKQKKVIHEVIV